MFRRAMGMALGTLLVLAVPAVGAGSASAEPVSALVSTTRTSAGSQQSLLQGDVLTATATGGVARVEVGVSLEPAAGARLVVGRIDFAEGGTATGPLVSYGSGCTSRASTLKAGYLDVVEVTYGADGRVTRLAADMSLDCTSRVVTSQLRLASEVPYVAVGPDNGPFVVNTITGRPARALATFTNRGPVSTHPGQAVPPAGATVVTDHCSGTTLAQGASCTVEVDATQSGYVHLPVPELEALDVRAATGWEEPVGYSVLVNQYAAPPPVTGLSAHTAVNGVGLIWNYSGTGAHYRVEQQVAGSWVILENGTYAQRFGASLPEGETATFRVTPGSPGGLDPSGAATVQGASGGLTFPAGSTIQASLDGSGIVTPNSVVPEQDALTIYAGDASQPRLRVGVGPWQGPGTYSIPAQGQAGASWSPEQNGGWQSVTGTITITRAQYSIEGVPQAFAAVVRGTRQSPSGSVGVSAFVLLNSVPTGLPGYLTTDPGAVFTRLPVGMDQTFPVALRNLGGAPVVVPPASVVATFTDPSAPSAWTVSTSCAGATIPAGGQCSAAVRAARPTLNSPGFPTSRATWGSGAATAAVDLRGDWGDSRVDPTVSLATPASSTGAVSVSFQAADPQPGDTVTAHCRLDGRAFVSCRSPWVLQGLSAGTHTVTVYATDQLGHMSTWARTNFSVTSTAGLTAALVADGRPDLLARQPSGELSLYRGNGNYGFLTRQSVGKGFNAYTKVFSPGDFTGDGRPDVMGYEANGSLWLHSGSATTSRQRVGTGFQGYDLLVAPGDFSGDRRADLIGRGTDGVLWLYRGNGAGGWSGSRVKIGSGWGGFATIVPASDFTGDGRADLFALDKTGSLWLYRGNGTGGFAGPGTRIGTGWGSFTALVAGDFSGDRRTDLVARSASGSLYLYRGNGVGRFLSGTTTVGTGWQGFDVVTGVR